MILGAAPVLLLGTTWTYKLAGHQHALQTSCAIGAGIESCFHFECCLAPSATREGMHSPVSYVPGFGGELDWLPCSALWSKRGVEKQRLALQALHDLCRRSSDRLVE